MTTDRTKPPPGWCESSYSPGLFRRQGRGISDYVSLADMWAEHDRIILPARVALLRELAAEIDGGPDVIMTHDNDFIAEKSYAEIADMLRTRADALEKDAP
jgi:hypothetical protein